MYLRMYLGKMLIEEVEMDVTQLTVAGRESYVQDQVDWLRYKHLSKIELTRLQPEFFLEEVMSKGEQLAIVSF
jgi:hypothetical protein